MSKKLDLTKSLYDLCKEYPELIDIMVELGFTEAENEMTLNTVGRVMRIPKGAQIKKIPMNKVVMALMNNGFELAGNPDLDKSDDKEPRNAADIMKDKMEAARILIETKGHPLNLFAKENKVLITEIDKTKELMLQFEDSRSEEQAEMILNQISLLRTIAIHYAKKGDLLYPHMKHKYEISGPSDLMWTDDDEIRDELRRLDGCNIREQEYLERLARVIKRMEEMLIKEKNVLFPICAKFFQKQEWYNIYQDSKDYAKCFVEFIKWPEAEEFFAQQKASCAADGDIIRLPGGHFTPEQLRAVLNTIPIEISFVDENNINAFFNEGPKLFKRATMAIDRDVFSCHPPKIEMMVRSIIDDFRSGVRDSVPVWMEKEGIPVLVNYIAVRDENGKYLGTLECVQKMDEAKKHFGK